MVIEVRNCGADSQPTSNVRPNAPNGSFGHDCQKPGQKPRGQTAILFVPSLIAPALLKNPPTQFAPNSDPFQKLEPVHFSGLAAYALRVPQSPHYPHISTNYL